MAEKLISEKFTFNEICGIISGKKDKYFTAFHDLFDLALLFCPSLKIPSSLASAVFEQDITVSLLQAKERFGTGITDIIQLAPEKAESYYVKYNNMIKAHFLLIFSAYYDSVRILLPDKEYKVTLDDETTYYITLDAIKEYAEKFADTDTRLRELESLPGFPHELSFYTFREKELRHLYEILTDEFSGFYQTILDDRAVTSETADKIAAKIRALPSIAIENYSAQYLMLKEKSDLFSAYAYTGEHKQLAEKIDALMQLLLDRAESDAVKRTQEVLNAEKRYYESLIRKRVLYGGGDDEYTMLPSVEYIFTPQSYKSLVFNSSGKNRTLLGPDGSWENIEEKDDLTEYIAKTANSPTFGRKPIIILGEPGGGKSTLCNILASSVFPLQYHILIVRLREVNASVSIDVQIEQQIKRDIAEDITWSDIRKCVTHSEMPLLLIFDGYDELLRVGGRRYTDFIQSVYRFQQTNEEIFRFFVRVVVTSRKNLIDLAEIPNKSAVIYLQDFSEEKISQWTEKWNRHNSSDFAQRGILLFSVRDSYARLAKQPLLLTMLAVYDYEENALARETHMNTAVLYENLLNNYVTREMHKVMPEAVPSGADRLYACLHIAAMGMLNRDRLCITREQFEEDLAFYDMKSFSEDVEQLSQGVRLFGSFFFVNTSQAKDASVDHYTYEFLHNTFGEYLAADYILNVFAAVIGKYKENDGVSDDELYSLYAVLCFACLCEKPNIFSLIREKNNSTAEPLEKVSDFVTAEIKKVITGQSILQISRWLNSVRIPYDENTWIRYSALYAINLIGISASVDSNVCIPLSDAEWHTFVQCLRAGLKEEELEVFAYLHMIFPSDTGYEVHCNPVGMKSTDSIPHVEKAHLINHILCDEVNLVFSGTVFADYLVEPYIEKHHFEVKSELYYLMLVKDMCPDVSVMNVLQKAQNACFEEKNYHILIALYDFLQDKSRIKIKNKNRYLIRFFRQGISLFSKAPSGSYNDKDFRKAFAEFMNFSLCLQLKYDDYKQVVWIFELFPTFGVYELSSVLLFLANGVSFIPTHERAHEAKRALMIITVLSSVKHFRHWKVSDQIIGTLIEILRDHSMQNTSEGQLFRFANDLIRLVMSRCKKPDSMSERSKHYLLSYLAALFTHDKKSYYQIVDAAVKNTGLIKLCKYWARCLSDYSSFEIYAFFETLTYIRTLGVIVDNKTLIQCIDAYRYDKLFGDELYGSVRRLTEACGANDTLQKEIGIGVPITNDDLTE